MSLPVNISILLTLMLLVLSGTEALCQSKPDSFPYLGFTMDENCAIVSITGGAPAFRAGMAVGDKVFAVNGKPNKGLTHDQVVGSLRGGVGVPVTIAFGRGQKSYQVRLIHEASTASSASISVRSGAGSTMNITGPRAPIGAGIGVGIGVGANAGVGASASRPPKVKPDDLDNKLVGFKTETNLTQQAVDSVIYGLSFLPRELKQAFIQADIMIVVTPTLEQFNGKKGRSEYDSATRTAVICERNTDGTDADLPRLHIIALHELGHAVDQMLGYPSIKDARFKTTYFAEAARVPTADRSRLEHFLQAGPSGASECFAALFVCNYFSGSDPRLDRLKADFPNSFQLVRRAVSSIRPRL